MSTGPRDDLTSYVGRERELAEATGLLGESRLVTLTGSGGVGKTRLAIRITRALAPDYADGAVLAELADARDPALVAAAVANALGLRALSGRPTLELVVDHLRNRRTLVVLDNCEHLLDAAAAFASTLLAECPKVTVLATSRQSLGAEGERVLPVPPLPVPDVAAPAAEVAACDSVRLFTDRATAVLPSFEVTDENRAAVVALTRRLDGVPLAIELAAARVRSLSPEQILSRLRLPILTSGARTAPHRQQTLRATIDWSHDLCTPAERLVWARASAFSGSFDLEAAEFVCGGEGVTEAEVLDLVDALLDKSVLIREDHGDQLRYRMLETLREYGRERLAGEVDRVARRHRDWYQRVAGGFAAGWLGSDQLRWLSRLPRELPNIWLALEYCVSTPGEAATAIRVLDGIRPYWTIYGHMNEVRRFLGRAVPQLDPDQPEYRIATWIDGFLAALRGDAETGGKQLMRAQELAEVAGDDAVAAEVAFAAGMGLFLGDLAAQAIPFLDKALAIYREHAFFEGEVNALCFGGFAYGFNGDVATATALLDECVARSEAAGEIYFRGWAMCALGYVNLEADRAADAERYAKQSLRYSSATGALFIVAATVHLLAWTATREGRFGRAVTLFGAADVIWAQIDLQARSFPIWVSRLDKYEALTKQALGAAAYDENYSRGRAMSMAQAVTYAIDDRLPATAPVERGVLTPREHEIARLVARGMTNREIAARLAIAQRTAETHVEHILTKLDASNRAQIAAWVAGQS
ncbi:ATP-binding protein [Actinokineospora sp. HUAS TT18]|uniref:ATP-binding protein n=1 Tax=Actinokineospora sp. HUAS TT18 TaxID=3447451 RepID=UPI003F52129F